MQSREVDLPTLSLNRRPALGILECRKLALGGGGTDGMATLESVDKIFGHVSAFVAEVRVEAAGHQRPFAFDLIPFHGSYPFGLWQCPDPDATPERTPNVAVLVPQVCLRSASGAKASTL